MHARPLTFPFWGFSDMMALYVRQEGESGVDIGVLGFGIVGRTFLSRHYFRASSSPVLGPFVMFVGRYIGRRLGW